MLVILRKKEKCHDGRQYVAVTATGGTALFPPGGGDSLVAFDLPR